MTLVSEIQSVCTQHDLEKACELLSKASWITLDTEFIRERTYWPEPALFQVSALDCPVFLIDPLIELDFSPFWELLTNSSVVKVFHAGRQDIEIFWKMGGVIPNPVFDTQSAALMAGLGEQVSYEFLVGHFTGCALDKTCRLSNWKQRPLTDIQIQYAASDVTHLRQVYQELHDILVKLDRLDWMSDDIAILQNVATYDIDPETMWQKYRNKTNIFHNKNHENALGILKTLTKWREMYAKKHNRSRSTLFKDEALYEMIKQLPETLGHLKKIRGIPVEVAEEHGDTLLYLIAEGLCDPSSFPPEPVWSQQFTSEQNQMVEHLRLFFQSQASHLRIPMKILMGGQSDAIERLISFDETDKTTSSLTKGWRKRAFGDKIVDLINGKASLKFIKGVCTLV